MEEINDETLGRRIDGPSLRENVIQESVVACEIEITDALSKM